MKIYIASDHAGFEVKKELIPWLKSLGNDVKDFGAFELNENDDFPDFIAPLARSLTADAPARRSFGEGGDLRGIIIGGSGQGEAMLANRFRGVRAAVYQAPNLDIIKFARLHNNANVLCIGARFFKAEEVYPNGEVGRAVKLFLSAPFSSDPKYQRRIDKSNRYMSNIQARGMTYSLLGPKARRLPAVDR